MTKPLVSVVMPAYNAANYIKESIASVIEQSYTNWELIVVDDGSTDETAAIVKSYRSKDERIHYFFQENGRQGKAKNLAIKKSTGVYIAFLDADDLWTKSKLEIAIEELSNGDYSLFFSDCYIFEGDHPDEGLQLKVMGVSEDVYQGKDAILSFLNYNRIPNLTVVAKKKILVEAGVFSGRRVAEEYEMWLKLLANGAIFRSIATPLAFYRVHPQSITAADRHATFEVIEIIKQFGGKYPSYYLSSKTIAKEKIKYWLYNGDNRTPAKFRTLIRGVFSLPFMIFFYVLSITMPVDQFRKIVSRSY